jgi:hypothetical protein
MLRCHEPLIILATVSINAFSFSFMGYILESGKLWGRGFTHCLAIFSASVPVVSVYLLNSDQVNFG